MQLAHFTGKKGDTLALQTIEAIRSPHAFALVLAEGQFDAGCSGPSRNGVLLESLL